ncbi:MAG: glycoside hydrolase family 2 protein, partial [Lewinella sp.]|nr:glycoside hydrolase family 2 protein [Lewinella sp.]
EGVYRDARVWINGAFLGRNLNGYLGFEYDLTPFIRFGEENVIAVHYDNRVPNTSRWYTGEGIYRDVWLKFRHPVYVATDGVYVTTPLVTSERARVTVDTEVRNDTGTEGEIVVETVLIDPRGEIVATRRAVVFLQFFDDYTFHQELTVDHPLLWDTENPNLYQAETTVRFNGEVQDARRTRFGIRDIVLSPDHGLLLNGRKVFARGGDIHHDLGCLGAVALEEGYRYRLQLLKDMGCNSLRLSHNPHAPVLLDLCDEMGLLVISEAYDKWTSQYYGGEVAFHDVWRADMERFLRRDRNHPSIYLWSVGNEVQKQLRGFDERYETEDDAARQGADYLRELVAFTHALDPTRLVTAALFPARQDVEVEWAHWEDHEAFMQSRPPAMAFNMDVVSWNYTGNFFGLDHEHYPQMMFIASETSTNLDFGNRRISMLEFDTTYVIGHYYWTALAYLGESLWPSKSWQRAFFGMDERQTPIGYIYQAFYSDEAFTKIMVKEPDAARYNRWDEHFENKRWSWYPMLEHWDFAAGDQLEVQAFTNCDEVELRLNQRSLGSRKVVAGEGPILYWDVPYQSGELVALGKRGGAVVATDTLFTAGAAATVRLSPNK